MSSKPNTLVFAIEEYDFEILAMELMPDRVRLFVSAAPKWAPGKIVSIFEAITTKIIYEKVSHVKRKSWGVHHWSAGYYPAGVGDKVIAEMVKKYIRHQRQRSFNCQHLKNGLIVRSA